MKFMVEIRLNPGGRNTAVAAFEERQPSRNRDVIVEGAWIGHHSEVAFVLVESEDEAHVAKAAELWSEFGQPQIHQVLDVQQY